jgi:REP element-mobilizing transposase RayT
MEFDPSIHHRRSIRWKGYDYSLRGLYFLTICAHARAMLFGRVADGRCNLSRAGEIVSQCWQELPQRFAAVALDAFVVMPNHLHGVLAIMDPRFRADRADATQKVTELGAASSAPTPGPLGENLGAALRSSGSSTSSAPTLGRIVRAFKSVSAIEMNRALRREGQPVWQRNYYEHVIRSAKELATIQRYIEQNPLRWEFDPENPSAKDTESNHPWRTLFP